MNSAGLLTLDATISRRLPRPEIDDQGLPGNYWRGHASADDQQERTADPVHGRSSPGLPSLVLG